MNSSRAMAELQPEVASLFGEPNLAYVRLLYPTWNTSTYGEEVITHPTGRVRLPTQQGEILLSEEQVIGCGSAAFGLRGCLYLNQKGTCEAPIAHDPLPSVEIQTGYSSAPIVLSGEDARVFLHCREAASGRTPTDCYTSGLKVEVTRGSREVTVNEHGTITINPSPIELGYLS